MTPILVSVEFDHDVVLPGKKPLRVFPPTQAGWKGDLQGWSMRVVGDRLEIVSPPGATPTPAITAECEANGLADACIVSSWPLDRVTLRYAGTAADVATAAALDSLSGPSPALAKSMEAPPPPPAPKPVPVAAAAQPGTPGKAAPARPPHAPTPAKRPPNARVYAPAPVSTEIEVDFKGKLPERAGLVPLEIEES